MIRFSVSARMPLEIVGRCRVASRTIRVLQSVPRINQANGSRCDYPAVCRKRFASSSQLPANGKNSGTIQPLLQQQASTLPSETVAPITPAPTIPRHGPGDGVITLNVGGKEFVTLRSTIDINPVLRSHVQLAEANKGWCSTSCSGI